LKNRHRRSDIGTYRYRVYNTGTRTGKLFRYFCVGVKNKILILLPPGICTNTDNSVNFGQIRITGTGKHVQQITLQKFRHLNFTSGAPDTDTVFAGYPAGQISDKSKSRIPDIR
jgi:hypothetical protein